MSENPPVNRLHPQLHAVLQNPGTLPNGYGERSLITRDYYVSPKPKVEYTCLEEEELCHIQKILPPALFDQRLVYFRCWAEPGNFGTIQYQIKQAGKEKDKPKDKPRTLKEIGYMKMGIFMQLPNASHEIESCLMFVITGPVGIVEEVLTKARRQEQKIGDRGILLMDASWRGRAYPTVIHKLDEKGQPTYCSIETPLQHCRPYFVAERMKIQRVATTPKIQKKVKTQQDHQKEETRNLQNIQGYKKLKSIYTILEKHTDQLVSFEQVITKEALRIETENLQYEKEKKVLEQRLKQGKQKLLEIEERKLGNVVIKIETDKESYITENKQQETNKKSKGT